MATHLHTDPFLYDLTIDAVMKKTVDSNIYDESNVTYLVEEKDQTMFFVGKQFDFSKQIHLYHPFNSASINSSILPSKTLSTFEVS